MAVPVRSQPELTGPPVRAGATAHALRLGAALTVAVAIAQLSGMRFSYWLPLTALYVLRPDYEGTVRRAFERALGTMAGVAVASLLVTTFHPSDAAIIVALPGLAAVAYALYFANYALSSVLATVLVALLVELGGGSPIGALGDRLHRHGGRRRDRARGRHHEARCGASTACSCSSWAATRSSRSSRP